MSYDRMLGLTEGLATKSDKMRVLERAGYARADIARFLGVRYQQVRNTLEGDKRTGYNPDIAVAETADRGGGNMGSSYPAFLPIEVGEDGVGRIPPEILEDFTTDEPLFAVKLDDGLFIGSSTSMIGRVRQALS